MDMLIFKVPVSAFLGLESRNKNVGEKQSFVSCYFRHRDPTNVHNRVT